VDLAPVPEATIDEHGHARAAKDDIRAAPPLGERPCVDAVPQPQAVDGRAEHTLATGIAATLPLHPMTHKRRGCRWSCIWLNRVHRRIQP